MVAPGDRLLVLLGRVRRRIRAQAALQGAIAGALVAAVAVNVVLLVNAVGRFDRPPAPAIWLTGLGFGLLGAALSLWRRPSSLAGAARRVDRAASGDAGQGGGDRVFVAFFLRGQEASELARAALEGAVRLATGTSLAAAAPWRCPRGLGLLGGLATLAIGLAVWPWPSAAESAATSREPDERARRAVRGELDRLHRAAGLRGDADLMALIAQADGLLARESGGSTVNPELRERLAAVAAAARLSAQAGTAVSDALARIAEALAAEPQTRAWAEALSRLEAGASEREASAASNRLSGLGAAERAALAEALSRAAAAAGALAGAESEKQKQAEAEEQRRRLSGLQDEPAARAGGEQQKAPPQEPGAAERSLKRLERDLQDTADRCRADPAACARAMNQAAESLGSEMARARSSGENQQLAQTLERELSRQAGAGGPGGVAGPSSGSGAGSSARGEAGGTEAPAAAAAAGETAPGAGAAAETAGGAEASPMAAGGGAGVGAGQGEGAGGDGPGSGSLAGGERTGEKREVRVPMGPGPSRAEVIEGGARRGFTEPGYRRVYRDYEAAIEETLDATAVPPGRRRLVRRYFDLIHPR